MANSTSVDSMTVIPDAGMSFEPTSTGGDNPSAGMGALPFAAVMRLVYVAIQYLRRS
jgi:hypothetical protein